MINLSTELPTYRPVSAYPMLEEGLYHVKTTDGAGMLYWDSSEWCGVDVDGEISNPEGTVTHIGPQVPSHRVCGDE